MFFRSVQRIQRVSATYLERLGAFQTNARLYLLNAMLGGLAMGVYRLLFNFFLLSLGYEKDVVGNLISASSLTALITALPMGYVVDRIGHKPALLIGSAALVVALGTMVTIPALPVLIAMNILLGLSQSLTGVTNGPFLMENSSEKERVYLFSLGMGVTMTAGFVGNWLGGYLPTWMTALVGGEPTSTLAYTASLYTVGVCGLISLFPLLVMKPKTIPAAERSLFAPFSLLLKNPGMIGKPILPLLITSVGAGLLMPFMNIFFRQVYNQPDPVIGTLFAGSSLAMGLGVIIAPPLADRSGKIQLVVITQALSIPFFILMGWAPWFEVSAVAYFFRAGLMNMSGPVYQTFVMEHAPQNARAMVASLVSMATSFGWAFSPTISGWLQVNYGFSPVFIATIVLYLISIYFYWRFFWPGREKSINTEPAV